MLAVVYSDRVDFDCTPRVETVRSIRQLRTLPHPLIATSVRGGDSLLD
jgi:hypothetical protein